MVDIKVHGCTSIIHKQNLSTQVVLDVLLFATGQTSVVNTEKDEDIVFVSFYLVVS